MNDAACAGVYISSHSNAPAINQPSGSVDVGQLGDAWRAMLRLIRSINLPILREIEYEEGQDSVFRFSNVGREVFVTLRDDNYISRSIAAVGAYGFEAFEATLRILGQPVDLMVDVGANIGSICIPAVTRGYAKRAVSIEPDRLNFRTLMANIYLNDIQDRVQAVNTALGAMRDEVLEFQISPDNKGDHRVCASALSGTFGEENWKRVRVPSTNLDSLMEEFRITENPARTLIWMDVQGWESRVFAGAGRILSQAVPIVIEFWPYGLRRNGLLEELVQQISNYFHTIHVVSWPDSPVYPATSEGVGQILERLDQGNDLSACDMLLQTHR